MNNAAIAIKNPIPEDIRDYFALRVLNSNFSTEAERNKVEVILELIEPEFRPADFLSHLQYARKHAGRYPLIREFLEVAGPFLEQAEAQAKAVLAPEETLSDTGHRHIAEYHARKQKNGSAVATLPETYALRTQEHIDHRQRILDSMSEAQAEAESLSK